MTERDASFPTHTWCNGLRFRDSRPLSPAERERLEATRTKYRHRVLGLAVGYVGLWLAVFPIMLVFREHKDVAGIYLFYLLVFAAIPGLPIVLFPLIFAALRWREVSRDLTRGTVECFVSAGREGAKSVVELVLTSGSRRVISGPFPSGVRLQPMDVVETEARDWWIPMSTGTAVTLERRRMHEPETVEIREAIRRVRRLDGATLVNLGMVVLLLLVGAPSGNRPVQLMCTALAVLNAALCMQRLWIKGRTVFASLHLGRDLRAAEILRVTPSEPEHPVVELLPHSKLVWRQGGAPALWRGRPAGPLSIRNASECIDAA